jgi:hypothetical protein
MYGTQSAEIGSGRELKAGTTPINSFLLGNPSLLTATESISRLLSISQRPLFSLWAACPEYMDRLHGGENALVK